MAENNPDIPKWDVALESLINEEHQKQGRPLNIDDFARLAGEHSIRLDDIMATVCSLTKNSRWKYEQNQNDDEGVNDMLCSLIDGSRLQKGDAERITGIFSPA